VLELALQRTRADKLGVTPLLPRAERVMGVTQPIELGRAVLDTERGTLVPVWALVLPTPHLDVDPTFVHTR
jgi:hypothetical protein